jgi:peptidoglycan/LPS O-acetylase OafA/YrhL
MKVAPKFVAITLSSLSALGHRSATLILSVIAVASFALNVVTVRYSPSFAFYLPLTRFWEFLAGTLLAYDSVKFGWTARLRRMLGGTTQHRRSEC